VTGAEVLTRCYAAGLRLRLQGDRLVAAPRDRLTDDLRELIRAHKADLVPALVRSAHPVHASAADMHLHSLQGAVECMGCANLEMRCKHHEGTRRVFWWHCMKGHALLEGRNFGERIISVPLECKDFEHWMPGRR